MYQFVFIINLKSQHDLRQFGGSGCNLTCSMQPKEEDTLYQGSIIATKCWLDEGS